jgi:hypothetical protein
LAGRGGNRTMVQMARSDWLNWLRLAISQLKIAEELFKGRTSAAESSSCVCGDTFDSSSVCEIWWRRWPRQPVDGAHDPHPLGAALPTGVRETLVGWPEQSVSHGESTRPAEATRAIRVVPLIGGAAWLSLALSRPQRSGIRAPCR